MALEVSFYLDRFHNLDLWQQGWYAIKLSCAWQGAERGAGVPSRVVQYEVGENGTDGLSTIWHINDNDHSFCTRPFRVKYARQDVVLAVIVSFSLNIRSAETMRKSVISIKSELLFAPVDGFLFFNSMHLELPSVCQRMYRIPSKLLHGFHGYCPLQFDGKYMAVVDLFVHTVVLGSSHNVKGSQGVEQSQDRGVHALLLASKDALAAQLSRIEHEEQTENEDDEMAKISSLWNSFLSLHRENRRIICEHLHASWLEGRHNGCSLWVIQSQRSIVPPEDQPPKSSRRGEDPATTSCTRAEMYRRGLMQAQADGDVLQDMQIFGTPSRQPILFLEQETFVGEDVPAVVEESSSSRKMASIVVFVHGFQGHHLDLRLIRNSWLLADPNAEFLMSEANEEDTSGELGEMGQRLADEVSSYLKRRFKKSRYKLSFVGHSIGNLIIRAALTDENLQPYLQHLHTFLSISGPHLGYLYSSNMLFNSGLWVLKKFKGSACMHQLTFTDSPTIEDCFIFKLSKEKTFEHFRHVLLLSSPQDRYVPYHSARIECCHAAMRDSSKRAPAFLAMLRNCEAQLRACTATERSLIRCDVNFDTSSSPRASLSHIIGRRAHIEFLETDVFIRFVMWSLPKCFDPSLN